jgi:uncharacterized membrane protein
MKTWANIGAVCLGGLLATCALAQPTFQGLGDLPGGPAFSRPWAISADGSTVVGVSRSVNGDEAFRWNASTGIVGLGDFPGGGFYSNATDVSADGSVVVGQARSSAGDVLFVWKPTTGMAPILDGFFPVWGSEVAVSDDGQKVVGIRTDLGPQQLFSWTSTGGLRALPGTPQSRICLSGDGRTIVCGNDRWVDGVASTPVSSTYTTSIAYAMNADGSTICGRSGNSGFPPPFACRSSILADVQPVWRTNVDSALARGVSDDSSIIVGTDGENAMYWSGPTGGVKLKDWLATKYGLQLVGWRLRSAVGISSDGKTIAGEGINPSGAEEAWILRLPDDTQCEADFNADGGVDFSDVQAFFERWESGC